MHDAPRIAIPRKTSDPDYGMIVGEAWGRPTFKVRFVKDGKRKLFTLPANDIEEARVLRDRFYANLKARYDVRAIRRSGRKPRRGMGGIYRRKPFYVKLDGKTLGQFDTLAEAKTVRDAYLKKTRK